MPEDLAGGLPGQATTKSGKASKATTDNDQLIEMSESPVKSPPARRQSTMGGGTWSAKYRQSRQTTSGDQEESGSPERPVVSNVSYNLYLCGKICE